MAKPKYTHEDSLKALDVVFKMLNEAIDEGMLDEDDSDAVGMMMLDFADSMMKVIEISGMMEAAEEADMEPHICLLAMAMRLVELEDAIEEKRRSLGIPFAGKGGGNIIERFVSDMKSQGVEPVDGDGLTDEQVKHLSEKTGLTEEQIRSSNIYAATKDGKPLPFGKTLELLLKDGKVAKGDAEDGSEIVSRFMDALKKEKDDGEDD